MKVGVIVAIDREYEQMLALLGGKDEGVFGENTIILRRSGIGKVNAAIGCTRMMQEVNPDCIISTGVAGAIGEGVNVLDVVVGREIVYHDVWCGEGNAYGQVQGFPERFRTDDRLYDAALSLEGNIHGGLICTGDIFAEHDDMPRILSRFPEAVAVDMESGSLAQTCHVFGKPFLSFRVISDSLRGLNNQADYENFWAEVGTHSFKMIHALLSNLPSTL